MSCGRPAVGSWERALCGVYGRTFTGSEYSLKTYCVPGTVLGLEERPEACVVPSKRLWLARGSRVQQICARQCSSCGRNRAPQGPEDNRNNSLFMKHLLCARRSSKRFHKIAHFIFPPPRELEQLPSYFAEEAAWEVKAGLVGGAELRARGSDLRACALSPPTLEGPRSLPRNWMSCTLRLLQKGAF